MTRLLSLSLLALILAACSTSQSESAQNIDQIEAAIDNADWDGAQKMLDRQADNTAELTAAQLGRISILYMRLSENVKEDENVASATQFYLKAFAQQPDSALSYYASLPLEQSQYVAMLSTLSRAVTSPPELTGDSIWDEEPDSISIPDHTH